MTKKFAFLMAAIILVSLIAGACGGGGGGTFGGGGGKTSFKATPITATVTLPAGSAAGDVSSLDVWTSGGETKPAADGKATVTVYNGGPQYTDVRDASGRMVLAGFIGTDRTQLNAESTAELLAFFHTGGAHQIDSGPLTFLQGIKGVAGFGAVVTAVTNQLNTLGYIDVDESGLKSALHTLAANLGGTSPTARIANGTIATPTSNSGISVDTLIDGQVTFTNVYLRRVVGFLQRKGYRMENGEFEEALGPTTQINIDPVKRFSGVVGTITDLARGQISYSPVVTNPYPVPLEGPAGTEGTVYEFRYGGMGNGDPYPNLFKGDELDAHRMVVMKTILLDAIFPIIIKIILPIEDMALGSVADFAGNSAVFAELLNAILLTAPAAYEQAMAGNHEDAVISVYESMVGSGVVLEVLARFITALGEHLSPENFFTQRGSVQDGVMKRLGAIGIVDLIGTSADMLLFFGDLARSDIGSKMEIISTGGKATIDPEQRTVPIYHSTTMKVIIQNKNPDAVYRYEWSVSDGFSLTNSSGSTKTSEGGVLVSSSEFAAIANDEEKPGTAKVRCKVVRIDGAEDRPVDHPMVEIKYVPQITLTPNPAKVDLTKTLKITANFEGEEDLFYKFSLSSAEYGTIDRSNIGNNPNVNFTAGSKSGTVTLKMEAFLDSAGTQPFQTINLGIKVGNAGVLGAKLTEIGSSTIYPPEGGRYHIFYVGTFTGLPAAHKEYSVSLGDELLKAWTAPPEQPEQDPEHEKFLKARYPSGHPNVYYVLEVKQKIFYDGQYSEWTKWSNDTKAEMAAKWKDAPVYISYTK